jgi:hypothetical protein
MSQFWGMGVLNIPWRQNASTVEPGPEHWSWEPLTTVFNLLRVLLNYLVNLYPTVASDFTLAIRPKYFKEATDLDINGLRV